jgi:hypothetical protein
MNIAAQIVAQGIRRRVAMLRLLVHRLQDNGVEVALQGLSQRLLRDRIPIRPSARHGLARAHGIGRQDRVLEIAARRTSLRVGPPSAEELVEDDAERIDIRGRRERLALDLFGRGVFRRQRRAGLPREFRLGGRAVDEKLGDAEVEQHDLAALPDQDVGGLQIAVNDVLAVRVRDCAEHLQKEYEPLIDPKLVRIAVRGERFPGDELHGEKGLAPSTHAGVINMRDVRVRQVREDVAFAGEPIGELSSQQMDVGQLQRDGARGERVGAHRQPHRAHAATADLANQPVEADDRVGLKCRLNQSHGLALPIPLPVRNAAPRGPLISGDLNAPGSAGHAFDRER